ncbi:hypothetical protein OIU76_029309 [Salix suchowensis]|nr:hypothetical protein OIU76_029309 [Salix suchowensis]
MRMNSFVCEVIDQITEFSKGRRFEKGRLEVHTLSDKQSSSSSKAKAKATSLSDIFLPIDHQLFCKKVRGDSDGCIAINVLPLSRNLEKLEVRKLQIHLTYTPHMQSNLEIIRSHLPCSGRLYKPLKS